MACVINQGCGTPQFKGPITAYSAKGLIKVLKKVFAADYFSIQRKIIAAGLKREGYVTTAPNTENHVPDFLGSKCHNVIEFYD